MKLQFFMTMACMVLGLSAQAKDYHYTTVAGDLMNTRIYTLDNGLKVYLSVNKEKPRIQANIVVRTGSKNDPAETTGLAHYLEHLMFKGTRAFGTTNPDAEAPLLDQIEQRYEEYRQLTDPELRRQKYHEIDSISQVAAQYFIPNEYDKLMAAIGAEGTNAYTSNDVTCYTENIPSNEIDNWAKIQADRFQNMVIRGFHTELEAVYEEYNISLSKDQHKLFNALMAKLFPAHPYGTQTTIGTQEHLKNPSITNIKQYFSKWYVPNNCAICMAGDFDMDQTIAIIDRYFGQWKPAADVSQPVFPALKPYTAPVDTVVVGQEAETLWMGWRAEKAAALQNDTLEIVGELLSNGKAGLIDLDLLQTMKLMGAFAGAETLADHSFFIIAGTPKQGQRLDEVRQLLLAEIEKLKRGDFADDLLASVISNRKLHLYQSLDDNSNRVNRFADAFINGVDWKSVVGQMDRMANMTKQQIVDFANRFFQNNYVAIYKTQGVDTTQKKIEKPAITPIPTNRDLMSQFVRDVQNSKVEPIQPRFVDFQHDLTVTKTKRKLPLLYKQNTENGLFTLTFRYDFGQKDDNRYEVAADYIDYLGTDKYTAAEIKQKFYQLACSYSIVVNPDNIGITLSGLSENMPQALALLEELLQHAKADREAYDELVALYLKAREDGKKSQENCFQALYQYGVYGPHNSVRDVMSYKSLQEADPQQLLDLLKNLSQYEQTVLYYGPMTEKQLSDAVGKAHHTPKHLKQVPNAETYLQQTADKNEILLAPYDAKNIYLRMYHNEGRDWNPAEAATVALFNEYYGGGMNGIVFQELREARGLAYNAGAYYMRPARKGHKESYFTHIITQNDKMMDCVREFHQILNNMPASESAFQIAKDALTKQLASMRTTKYGVLNAYLAARRLGIDYDLNSTIYQALPALKLQDIVDFERRQMANKQYRYIILGDEQNLDIQSLEKIAPVRRVSLEEIFGY